jgi:hypothetical protein
MSPVPKSVYSLQLEVEQGALRVSRQLPQLPLLLFHILLHRAFDNPFASRSGEELVAKNKIHSRAQEHFSPARVRPQTCAP